MGLHDGAPIKKLNKTCLEALQAAAGLCLSRTNHSVEVDMGCSEPRRAARSPT